jgi:hypothetical protein
MQTELLDHRRWKIRMELANAIFVYLEISTTGSDATVPGLAHPHWI